jgi:hypothetical protein
MKHYLIGLFVLVIITIATTTTFAQSVDGRIKHRRITEWPMAYYCACYSNDNSEILVEMALDGTNKNAPIAGCCSYQSEEQNCHLFQGMEIGAIENSFTCE